MKVAKLTKLQKEAMESLPVIAAGNTSDLGYVITDHFTTQYLVDEGYAEVNEGITTEDGGIATRATQKGIDFVIESTASIEAPKQTATAEPKKETVKMSFEIETGVFEKPKTKRGGAGNSKYNLEKLEVGQSIFIAGAEAEKLGGTVSSANKRFAEEVKNADGSLKMKIQNKGKNKGTEVVETVLTRKFEVYNCEKDGVKGARIGRTK